MSEAYLNEKEILTNEFLDKYKGKQQELIFILNNGEKNMVDQS